MSSSNNKNPAEDVSKAGATGSSVADDVALREQIDTIFNHWHKMSPDGTSEIILREAIVQHTAATVQAARLNELQESINTLTQTNWSNSAKIIYLQERIKELQADTGRSGEGTS